MIHAQSSPTSPENEYKKNIRVSEDIQPLGAHPFGENISLYDGSLSFEQTDMSLAGQGPMLSLRRKFELPGQSDLLGNVENALGNWDLDLPRITTITANQQNVRGWEVAGIRPGAICSGFNKPPSVNAPLGDSARVLWDPSQWWHGYQLVIPGQGSQDLLARSPENTQAPAMNGMSFPIVTKTHWQISCLAQAENDGKLEAFLAVAPDGSKYWFNHLVYRYAPSMQRELNFTPTPSVSARGGAQLRPQVSPSDFLQRREASMLVTRVEDRFGHSLVYAYDGFNRLTGITASDGRALSVQYIDSGPLIHSVTLQPASAAQRTWTYSYRHDPSDYAMATELDSVTLPDGSAWRFNLPALTNRAYVDTSEMASHCNAPAAPNNLDTSYTGSMTHPSGLIGTFTVKAFKRGRSYVPRECWASRLGVEIKPDQLDTYALMPAAWYTMAITQRQYSGAGVPTQTWQYQYSPSNPSWIQDSCASAGNCPTTVWSDEIDPAGNATRATFSNRFDASESQLQRTDVYQGAVAGGPIRSEIDGYASPIAGPWPTRIGSNLQSYINQEQTTRLSPLNQRQIVQEGDTYTWQVPAFNIYTAPRQIDRYSSATGQHFTVQMSYLNDPARWVLSLPLQATNLVTNEVELLNTYASNDTLLARARFGQTLMNYTHDAHGQLTSFTDGNNHTTSLGNYYRGIPQLINYPDQTSESRSVDDYGQITRVIDQAAHTTGYSYDSVGRLTRIDYPGGDAVAWAPKTFSYNFVTGAERGIAANHWTRTTTQGSYQGVTIFDAQLRPLIENTAILGVVNSDIATGHAYDWQGQSLFTSHPVIGAADLVTLLADPGTHYRYDPLGREIETAEDTELGALKTTTAYLPGAGVRVTDPKGNPITMRYQVFDQPSTSAITQVSAPTGITQTITRDLYGNPTAITQSGPYSGSENNSVTRSFTYDIYHRPCRRDEPETGSTVLDYDGANNVRWRATGLALAVAGCARDQMPATARTARTYDAMNRVLTITPPAGTQSTSYQYDALGHMRSAVSGIATQSYSYNALGLLTGETLQVPGYSWSLGYAYDANGHRSLIRYPNGETVDYSPNPRGRDRQAGGYASGLNYYANGTERTHMLANGITALMQLNTRQLPFNLSYARGGTASLSEGYIYDANANLTAITDTVNGRNTQSLSYDALDRLTSASAPNAWGTESYTYDALNNVRSRLTGGVLFTMNYDATQRLSTFNIGSTVFASYTHDARGNRNSISAFGKTQPYVFDAENQLLSVTGVSSYAYDADGHRVAKTLASGATTYSFYSHAGPLMAAYDPSSGLTTNYIYLNGKLIARHRGPTTTYLLTDRLGSPVRETDTSGDVTASFSYLPYGSLHSGPSQNEPAYTGHVNDTETLLSYMQARYNDGGVGQFLSVDPVGPKPGDVFGFNRYAYADNNPIKNTDPNGQNAIKSYNSDGSINIQVPINFSGPGATQANISAIKSDVAKHWTGLYSVAGEITKISVAVTDVTSDTPKKAINNITLLNGPTSDKTTQGASFIGSNNVSGEWNMTSNGMNDGEAAHETGHLMGDTDYYGNGTDANGNRVTTAKAGYANNLMGALGPTVIPDSRNMNVILNSPINMTQNPPPPPPKTNQ